MKLGTSHSLDGIRQVIEAFYLGAKELRQTSETTWSIHKADGTQLSTQVRLHKGRYLFETRA